MAEVEKEKEFNLRDYWEIFLKRRFAFLISSLLILVISTFYILFIVDLKYKAEARVIIGPPTVQVEARKRMAIKEVYIAEDELELMRSNIVAERASALLKSREDYEISPGEISGMLSFGYKLKSKSIDIRAISTEPEKAYFAVKGVIEAYIEETEEHKERVIKEAYNALSKQLLEKGRELEEAERSLTKFVIEHDIIARGIEVGKGVGKKAKGRKPEGPGINEKYLALKAQRINEESFMEEVKSHREEDEVTALSIIAKKEKALVDLTLRDELYEKERELSKLLLTQSELHPDVIEVRGEVEEAKKKINLELDRAIQSLEISLNTLKREEEKLRTLIKEGLSEKMVEYGALKRDVEVKKDIYNTFVKQLQQLDVSEKLGKIPFLKIVKAPTIPGGPINPRSKSMLKAFLLAIFAGVSSTFVLECLDISIKDVEDVEDILGLNVLAAIPVWKRRPDEKAIEKYKGRYELGLVTMRHLQSMISEAFRTLRTNIRFVSVDKDIKSILVTSVGPKEGKSTIAANLAATMARAGECVVLVDGDLRKPVIHKYFNIDNSKGLSSILIGEESIEEIEMNTTELESLKVIPSGPIPPNPNELLGTERMDEIFAKLKARSDIDVVIIDSPPVLTVSDSLILGAKADGVVLALLANKTAKKAGARANLMLKNAGANVLGGVLNEVEVGKGRYYYYSYKYYDYYGKES